MTQLYDPSEQPAHLPDEFADRLVTATLAAGRLLARRGFADAEDLAQEAALRTWRAARNGSVIAEGSASEVAAYVVSAAKTAYASERRHVASRFDYAPAGWYSDPADSSGTVDRWWNGKAWTERARDVDGEYQSLPATKMRPQNVLPGSLSDHLGAGVGGVQPDPAMASFEDQVIVGRDVRDAKQRLSRHEAAALDGHLAGHDDQTIAEELGRTASAARSLRTRAYQKLRRELGDHEPTA